MHVCCRATLPFSVMSAISATGRSGEIVCFWRGRNENATGSCNGCGNPSVEYGSAGAQCATGERKVFVAALLRGCAVGRAAYFPRWGLGIGIEGQGHCCRERV